MTATKLVGRGAAALAALALALGLSASTAGAQTTLGQGGLVNVGVATGDITLEEVLVFQDLIDIGDITLENLVNVGNVDVIVQVPIGIAANVCPAVTAAVLGQAAQEGTVECVADAASAADSHVFQRWLQRQ
jgi:hypothetical protein